MKDLIRLTVNLESTYLIDRTLAVYALLKTVFALKNESYTIP